MTWSDSSLQPGNPYRDFVPASVRYDTMSIKLECRRDTRQAFSLVLPSSILVMSHPRQPQTSDKTTPTNETRSRIYSEVWGNVPDLRSLSSLGRNEGYGPDNSQRTTRRGTFKRFMSSMRFCRLRHGRAPTVAPGVYGIERNPQMMPTQHPSCKLSFIPYLTLTVGRRAYPTAGMIGETVGNTSFSPLAPGAHYEQNFRDDPSLLPREDSLQFPTDVTVVGNFSSGEIGANAKMAQTFEPRRVTGTESQRSSVVTSQLEPLSQDQTSRHGFSVIIPQYTHSAPPSTFPGPERGQTIGQRPAEKYSKNRRR
ncbi:hypothetical protein BKA70DRAFT_1269001 [Coprinopsis sp. MPI-PUGE-AT-0042]|nr:hypothetical protein BKA70DRAFT_1269001 [Coprinopsis sp. MPI-PUGE-AT-0042]